MLSAAKASKTAKNKWLGDDSGGKYEPPNGTADHGQQVSPRIGQAKGPLLSKAQMKKKH